MRPTASNAFNGAGEDLASRLRPMHVEFRPIIGGSQVLLTPMRAADAIRGLVESAGASPARWLLAASDDTDLEQLAGRMGIPVHAGFEIGAVVLDGPSAVELAALAPSTLLYAVRIAGAIEPADVTAILRALVEPDASALDVECRCDIAMTVERDHLVAADVRDPSLARLLIALDFRQYVAALLREPIDRVSAPTDVQLERLLSVTGTISVRPIETEVFSTSIDIGIATELEPAGPATRSLVYDRPSATWHDEP